TVMNKKARTVKYQSQRDYIAANFASRTMRYTGVIFLIFLVWHLFDLTFTGTGYTYVRGLPYENVSNSLSRFPVALLYIVGNLALGVHLFHGAWSLFQSMGWNNPRFNSWRRNFAAGFAALIVIGNVSFPIAVLAGVVG
ncbi:MAG: succinate dehydrogenase cytochrome b subunit, partial [Acidimicrobiales bacterium]|nr:succinate dehydrogenase cytochrome b subunit [Acidimicrobiales bacterium]